MCTLFCICFFVVFGINVFVYVVVLGVLFFMFFTFICVWCCCYIHCVLCFSFGSLSLSFVVLLQVLDEGRLTDNKGRVADFKNTIIIMTSNIGSHIIQEKFSDPKADLDAVTELAKVEVLGLLKQSVRPEFLNRIDDVIMFTPLNQNNIFEIVKLQIEHLKKMIGKQEITLDATDEAISYLAKKGYQPEFGARPVKRVIQKEVLNQLSKEILSGKITTDSIILLDSFDDKLVFRNQSDLVENS